jgi:arginase
MGTPDPANIVTGQPETLRLIWPPLLDWLASSGCSRVAIHFDVDAVDSNQIIYGLGADPDGLRNDDVRRVGADIASVADVVGSTIAEFIPRQMIRLQRMLRDLPLIQGHS